MEVHFKIAHVKDVESQATDELTSQGERKISALKKYLGESGETSEAYVDLGRVTEAHKNGDVWFAQINIDASGEKFHAKAEGLRLQIALDSAIKEIEAELRSTKKKKENMLRKGGAVIKSFMQDVDS